MGSAGSIKGPTLPTLLFRHRSTLESFAVVAKPPLLPTAMGTIVDSVVTLVGFDGGGGGGLGAGMVLLRSFCCSCSSSPCAR